MTLENAPESDCVADLTAASVDASIKSATASACAKSSLSFKKARCVNSPGSAKRKPISLPAAKQRANNICKTTGPPCPCNSNTSCPV